VKICNACIAEIGGERQNGEIKWRNRGGRMRGEEIEGKTE
jgi:hypothetical protein